MTKGNKISKAAQHSRDSALQNKDVSFDLENVKTDVVNTDAFFQGYLELFLFHQNVL